MSLMQHSSNDTLTQELEQSQPERTIEKIDEKEKWDPKDIIVEIWKQDEEHQLQNSPRKVFTIVSSICASILVGVFAGMRSRDFVEVFVFTVLYLSLAILSATIQKIMTTYVLINTFKRFTYLLIAAATISAIVGSVHVLLTGDI